MPDVATPAAPIINGAGGSGSFTGDYYAKVTFVDASGAESEQSVATSKLTLAGVTGISWSSIPTGGATIMQRKLYRTKTNGSIYYLAGTIDDNTTTTFADTVADASLTVLHPGIRRVILDPGKEKRSAAIITQTAHESVAAIGTSTVGQTITIPAGERKIYSISPYLYGIGTGEIVSLALYSDAAKTTTIASTSVTGPVSDGYVEFVLTDATTDATVTPGNVYYFEVTVPSGSVSIAYNSASVYEKRANVH